MFFKYEYIYCMSWNPVSQAAAASPAQIASLLPCFAQVRPRFELPARSTAFQSVVQPAAFGMVGSVLGATQIIVPQNSV